MEFLIVVPACYGFPHLYNLFNDYPYIPQPVFNYTRIQYLYNVTYLFLLTQFMINILTICLVVAYIDSNKISQYNIVSI